MEVIMQIPGLESLANAMLRVADAIAADRAARTVRVQEVVAADFGKKQEVSAPVANPTTVAPGAPSSATAVLPDATAPAINPTVPTAMPGTTVPPANAPAAVPVNPAPVPPPVTPVTSPAAPVAAPTYTLDQIAYAARSLSAAGRMADVQALVASYGVQTLAQLDPARYGAFATALRGMGATI